MRRRQHHVRSRNGCITCKARHVRCDERLPYCGNCLRVGRECIYGATNSGESSDSSPETPPLASSSMMSLLPPATQQAWVARNLPQGHAVNFLPPHYRDLDNDTNAILQQAHDVLVQRPMPRYCLLTVQRDHASRYNQLAAQHKCVKFAHVSFAAYTHYQETNSSLSRDTCIHYTGNALSELQQEIGNFSENADAIVTASICLAGAADDWEQWLVFVDGYSRASTYIRDNNIPTACPEMLGENFQIHSFFRPNTSAEPLLIHRALHQERVQSLITMVTAVRNVVGQTRWHSIGFSDLEQLAQSVDAAFSLDSDSEAYHKLAWLRCWMFWMEIRKQDGGDEQQALACYFYALLLSAAPLFPAQYTGSLTSTCVSRMQAIQRDTSDVVAVAFGIMELMTFAQDNLLSIRDGVWAFERDCWTVEADWDKFCTGWNVHEVVYA